MQWLWMFPLNAICSLLCYLTNWLVVIFADDRGELHGFLKYWQTWDDSLDVSWHVKEKVPAFLRYDFDAHYTEGRERTEALAKVNRDKGCVYCFNRDFTIAERMQRYCCRVLWLYRNCGYGFAFYLFGVDHNGILLHTTQGKNHQLTYGAGIMAPWQLTAQVWRFQIMAGWKLDIDSRVWTRSMIAGRIIFR